MAKRSIKESMNDAAFAFVKEGLSESKVTKPKPRIEPNLSPQKAKPNNPPKVAPQKPTQTAKPPLVKKPAGTGPTHLVSVSTRLPASVYAQLKRAALLRQLDDREPSSIQQIITLASEDWLRRNL